MTRARIGLVASLLASVTPAAAGTTVLDAKKQAVLAFCDLARNPQDCAAAAKYLGPRLIQHNANAADGLDRLDGLKALIEPRRAQLPKAESQIKRAFAEGDFVIRHVHSIGAPGERGAAIVDVAHWDVVQPIPKPAANAITMF